MKKLIVPIVCVLVGCAAGVAMPTITAQSYGASAPGAQRWENYCAFDETSAHTNQLRHAEHRTAYNRVLRELGSQGWELVGTIGEGWRTPCFRRPAR